MLKEDLIIDIDYITELKKYSVEAFVYSCLIGKRDPEKLFVNEAVVMDANQLKQVITNYKTTHPDEFVRIELSSTIRNNQELYDEVSLVLGDDLDNYKQELKARLVQFKHELDERWEDKNNKHHL